METLDYTKIHKKLKLTIKMKPANKKLFIKWNVVT